MHIDLGTFISILSLLLVAAGSITTYIVVITKLQSKVSENTKDILKNAQDISEITIQFNKLMTSLSKIESNQDKFSELLRLNISGLREVQANQTEIVRNLSDKVHQLELKFNANVKK